MTEAPARLSTRERARQIFTGKLVLGPMTKGSNVPFRRLCREFGVDVTVGEMAVAKKVNERRRGELALLRVHPQDRPFGAQLADRDPATLAAAAATAEDMGSDFVDLNCGCPIDHFTSKGLGAAILRKPRRFGELIGAMRRAVTIPVTVKIRSGWNDASINYPELARIAQEQGADAITLHARTRDQRYTRAADWQQIGELAGTLDIPVIGNGDLLAHWEVSARWQETGCAAVMTARGALIKPWIFQEVKEQRAILLSATERLAIIRRYTELAREHFGDDAFGTERVREFLIWHLGFFCRYRPLSAEAWQSASFAHPLLQTRMTAAVEGDDLTRLLARPDPAAHEHLARIALREIDADAPPPPEADATDAVMTVSNG